MLRVSAPAEVVSTDISSLVPPFEPYPTSLLIRMERRCFPQRSRKVKSVSRSTRLLERMPRDVFSERFIKVPPLVVSDCPLLRESDLL